jgi:putative ABC transport system ATP-binding protein
MNSPATGPAGGVLSARGVVKIYRHGGVRVRALDEVDLVVKACEFIAIAGPSAAGKSTLLRCLSGIEGFDSGTVDFEGRALRVLRDDDRAHVRAQSMGFVFTSGNLLPSLTVVENVELPLLLGGLRVRRAHRRAVEALERVGLVERRNQRPDQLGLADQQRAAVARAIVNLPRIVWADEPTGMLDTENAVMVMKLLCDLHDQGETIIYTTHDADVASVADRVVRMRDGRVISDLPVPRTAPAIRTP